MRKSLHQILISNMVTLSYAYFKLDGKMTTANTSPVIFKFSTLSVIYIYNKHRHVSAHCQLEEVCKNADRGATWRLYYETCLQGIHTKQITTGSLHKSTTQQWHLHQWVRRSHHHLEMVHTVYICMARFTITIIAVKLEDMLIKLVRLDYCKLIIFSIPFVVCMRVRVFLGFKKGSTWTS
jgi:hypothetical protein